MKTPKEKRISKEDFLKLNEEKIMFITNPGRMGDEDGSTFIIKNGNEFTTYRIDDWMYHNKVLKDDEYISLDDAQKQFPKWYETWKHRNNNEKYKYIYTGFGNGLSIDNSIYNEFEPYLNELVEENLKNHPKEKESLKYVTIYKVWKKAFIKMAKDKKYILK